MISPVDVPARVPTLVSSLSVPPRISQHPRPLQLAVLLLLALLLPRTAHAQSAGIDPATVAQNIENFMTGSWGKSIAAVAFGCVGLVAWWGFMSWARAAMVVAGGVMLFSAPWFVTTFFGQ
jgi:type IV secretory pathway VirB2 component (pilin)